MRGSRRAGTRFAVRSPVFSFRNGPPERYWNRLLTPLRRHGVRPSETARRGAPVRNSVVPHGDVSRLRNIRHPPAASLEPLLRLDESVRARPRILRHRSVLLRAMVPGWCELVPLPRGDSPVVLARTWLGAAGWRRYGLLGRDDRPRSGWGLRRAVFPYRRTQCY